MDKVYADAVRLLLAAAPEVFANDIFAMKGGTAINLFVRDMPRLSVDIDVVYTPWQIPREQALAAIAGEIEAIAGRLAKRKAHANRRSHPLYQNYHQSSDPETVNRSSVARAFPSDESSRRRRSTWTAMSSNWNILA